MTSLSRVLAIVLLAGMALLGAGAVLHPMLTGDAATDLRLIAATGSWRAIHLAMLAGTALVMMGVGVRLFQGCGISPSLALAMLLLVVGLGINGLDAGYMVSAGWHAASRFAGGDGAMLAIYDITHPIGTVAARFGNLIVALGAAMLGAAEWRDRTRSRWYALLAWLAAAGGLVGAVAFDEGSRMNLGAVALLSGWQLVTAVAALRAREPEAAPAPPPARELVS
ncbi:MAG TPA: hypothetical protein VFK13_04820 [Gemmatimonadaceae bacterium]|nr:hypothetical protein [Gemmatimonadaceae bacterium]